MSRRDRRGFTHRGPRAIDFASELRHQEPVFRRAAQLGQRLRLVQPGMVNRFVARRIGDHSAGSWRKRPPLVYITGFRIRPSRIAAAFQERGGGVSSHRAPRLEPIERPGQGLGIVQQRAEVHFRRLGLEATDDVE